MSQRWKDLAIGAGLATVIVVAFYEGRDRLGEAGVTVEGETGKPVRAQVVGDRDRTNAAAQELVSEARKSVAEMEHEVAAAKPSSEAEDEDKAARTRKAATEVFQPTRERLLREAENCRVRYVLTPLDAHGDPPKILDGDQGERWRSAGLGPEEVEAIDGFFRTRNAEFSPELRKLYVDATGDEAGSDSLSANAMVSEILARSDDAAARRQVAQERAGQAVPGPHPERDNAALRLHRARYSTMQAYYEVLGAFGDDRRQEILERMPIYQIGFGGCAPGD